MNLKVGANIRELRHKQGVTQEKLAEKLGTTPQAVSRWESEVGYPDIELLPHIADAFGVSLDELFGKDAQEKEAKIQHYLEECQRLGSLGEEGKRFALMREALELFPLDHRIMMKYAWAKAPMKESDDAYESIIAICNRVLDDNPNEDLRYNALGLLGMMYRTMGKTEEAVAVANRLPKLPLCRDMDLLCAYDSGSEEFTRQLQNMTETLTHMLGFICIGWSTRHRGDREKIRLWQKVIAVYDLIFDDGNFGFHHSDIAKQYKELGDCHLRLGELDEAIECFENFFFHAKAYDNLPEKQPYTAALVDRLVYRALDISKGSTKTMLEDNLPLFEDERYDALRENERFRALLFNV